LEEVKQTLETLGGTQPIEEIPKYRTKQEIITLDPEIVAEHRMIKLSRFSQILTNEYRTKVNLRQLLIDGGVMNRYGVPYPEYCTTDPPYLGLLPSGLVVVNRKMIRRLLDGGRIQI